MSLRAHTILVFFRTKYYVIASGKRGPQKILSYFWGKGVCKHKTGDCRLRRLTGQKRSIRRAEGNHIIKPTQDTFVLAWRKRRKQVKDKQTNAIRLFGQKRSLRLGAFQYHLVRHKRDKFPVRGLIVCCVNLYAENAVDIFDFAAIPGDFDCVSYRAYRPPF